MASLEFETDQLLADLGISSGGGSGAPAPAPAAAPGPPPPPPPPPAATASSSSSSIKLKTSGGNLKSAQAAQKEIDDIFDSVISFAGKTSSKKKAPPPVAPKPKRKIHVSSYSMQVKQPDPKKDTSGIPSKPEPPKLVAVAQAPPPPPPPPKTVSPPAPSTAPAKPPPPAAAAAEPDVPPEPVAMVAFGPGLETLEVNCYGDFQISCPHDTTADDLEVNVKGPTGSKPVEITEHGNGQFSASYLPTAAGDHIISIKVEDKPIQGSPFTAHVKFAAYTDKCSAEGPGLVSGTTTEPCHFKIRSKDEAGYARMRIHVVGPSKAEPIEMVEDMEEKCVNVTYHPSAAGDYTVRVLWGEANVHGSPFTVPVTGDTVNDPSKVIVMGDGLKGGEVNQPLKFFVEGEAGAGPGPLGVRMVGPSKPTITADDSSEDGVELVVLCQDPGEYQLILKWGTDEVPTSPYTINITGEGREVRPELCTATGDGVSTGKVGDPVTFTVNIPDEAGPGTMGVSVSGPHPPKPIDIVNNQDGTMVVTYHPIAPGNYTIDITWAEQHISGSPFTAVVSGDAVRNPKLVSAEGEIIGNFMKCNQLGTITVTPKEGAGAGPLRAKLEGPAKADLQLMANPDGTMLVSFIPKESGHYNLHLLWGEGEEEGDEINESPFLVKVEK
jgi:filamin